jgi:hypothetical protein
VDGKVVPTSKTAAFQKAAKVPVHVPLSGRNHGVRRQRALRVGLLRTAVSDQIQLSFGMIRQCGQADVRV